MLLLPEKPLTSIAAVSLKDFLAKSVFAGLLCSALFAAAAAQTAIPNATTAWKDGRFQVDAAGVIGRSDIVLARPNRVAGEAMPLGNGRLGVAIWSEDGLTAQLNRADTLPDRLSPGQLVLPGLAALTDAKDYSGRLDLYNGEFRERGGGMAATAYVQPHTDVLVVDVTGANPNRTQTAQLKLWKPRTPRASVSGRIGILSQPWIDNRHPGYSGRPFGSLSAITADGRNVSAVVTDPLTITISFKPYADGRFRILVAAPHYDGRQVPLNLVRSALATASSPANRLWWHDFWKEAAPIKITSADGTGEYIENLRNIYLFDAAAEKGVEYPGSQAGVADMLSSGRDAHRWDSSAFWHWNLRMQVAANIGAGLPELNGPYFNLYRENLPSIEQWTRKNMNGRPGVCVPETMRFNGQGIEYESSWDPIRTDRDCDASYTPYYNARTISTGADVSLWIWRQYLVTNDRAFLARNYPVMAASARFLLAYQKQRPDGLLHTSPSNAHETQWDVTDPTTDIAAARALYPATIQAATLLGKDPDLVSQLQTALPKIPPFPRTQETGARTLLPPSADAGDQDVIAESYLPGAPNHNAENIGLEPVWPYDLIGDTSPLFALARRTYEHRLFRGVADWSFDPIQAARLDLGSEVGKTLAQITERSQHSVNGLANWDKQYGEFYIEQIGVVAAALQEMLVQDYDGLLRIAPAVPPGWNVDGSVYVRGRSKVDVQVRDGVVTTTIIEAGTTRKFRVRNPWPGHAVDIVSGRSGARLVQGDSGPILTFPAAAGVRYLLQREDSPVSAMGFAPVNDTPARTAKRLGRVQIGLFGSDETQWTGTWATPSVQVDSQRSFNSQTLRQIVHTSVGGSEARVQISNRFGKRPLQVENVHLARPENGSSIFSGTDRQLFFQGHASITIPPGATVASDPVAFAVPALADVAISMYLPGPTGAPTFNPAAHQTSYIAPGNVSRSAILPNAAETGSWYFITNLDVQGGGLRGAVVTLGASITNGYKSTDNTNRRWPDILSQRLAHAGLGIGVLNEGISGNRLLRDGTGPSAESRFDRDVLAQPGVRWIIFSDDPINDLGSTRPPPPAEALINGIQRLIVEAHQRHVQFFCSTLTPYQGANYWTTAGEAARERINAFLRSKTSGCDAVLDQDAATHDPARPTRYLPAYDSGDHLHPNDAGMQAIADAVNLALVSQSATTTNRER